VEERGWGRWVCTLTTRCIIPPTATGNIRYGSDIVKSVIHKSPSFCSPGTGKSAMPRMRRNAPKPSMACMRGPNAALNGWMSASLYTAEICLRYVMAACWLPARMCSSIFSLSGLTIGLSAAVRAAVSACRM